MEVIIADRAGFCWGVKRALKIAEKTAEESRGTMVTSLGPIIHNPAIVEKLQQKGLKTERNLEDIHEGTVIIRAHGVSPDTLEEIQQKGLKVVDATCPIVKKSQRFAKRLTEEGYQVIIVGDKNHPEIIGILGHSNGSAIVLDDPEEASKVPLRDKVGLIAQTTHTVEEYERIQEVIRPRVKEMKACDTLCFETTRQQSSSVDVARQVDVMVVVGGRNSANTVRLANMCRETGVDTYHVESAEELQSEWFKGKKRAGVTGGASTPDFLINDVMQWLKDIPSE
jgi:4-hydroxy-3-methylbut-2-enyl diphosphate reductase